MKFFRKALLTVLTFCVFVLPLSSMALTQPEGASAPAGESEHYVPGGVPATISPVEAMVPALHGVTLAMLHHGDASLDAGDTGLMWECLYNMLSLYGQLDERSEPQGDSLTFPAELVWDYSAALVSNYRELGPLPAALSDRLTYDAASDCYRVVCGNDELAQIQVRTVRTEGDATYLEGALVYLVEQTDLARFQATLQPRDTMFGYAVTSFTLR